MIKVKLFVVIFLSMLSFYAHAGFVTGMIVGSALSGSGTKTQSARVVSSDAPGHDVITCCKYQYSNKMMCNDDTRITPAQYYST